MTHATGEPPQDAPPGQPWPGWPQAGHGAAGQPASTGPNWGLAAVGLLLVFAAGALLVYLLGYRPDPGVRFGPQVLIALGAVLLLVGAVGSLARRASAANRKAVKLADGAGCQGRRR